MSTKRDYYEILGLAKNASEDEIKKAYRKLSMKFHPDRVSAEEKAEAEVKFKEMKEAYEVLSNGQQRAAYDQYGHQEQGQSNFRHQASSDDIEEILRTVFGSSGNNPFGDIFGRPRSAQTHQRRNINITLENAFTGVVFKDNDVHLQLPPGIRHGTKFVHNTIIYQVGIIQHERFKRANDDLLIEAEISAIEAMLGVDVTLAHLDSSQLQFTIPAGIQGGQIVRLAGRGMKNPEINAIGDLLVRVNVRIPVTLTDEQRVALKTMEHRESFNL